MKVSYNSPVILTYSLICLAVLGFGVLLGDSFINNYFVIVRTSPSDPLLYVRMFTYIFGHADFNHFFSNLSMLLLIGPMVEEKYGSQSLLIMIIVTTLIGSLTHIAFFSQGALGASGIVFMLILLTPFTNTRRGTIPITFILVAIVFIGREIVDAIRIEDNVSRMGHIVGGIVGSIMGMYIDRARLSAKAQTSSRGR